MGSPSSARALPHSPWRRARRHRRSTTHPAWGFSAAFLAQPKLTETLRRARRLVRGHSLLVASNTGLDDFEVFALEAPPPAKSIDEFTDAAAPVVAKSLGDEVGATTYVATVQLTNRAMGREVQITKDGRPVFDMRVSPGGRAPSGDRARAARPHSTQPRWPSSTRSRSSLALRRWRATRRGRVRAASLRLTHNCHPRRGRGAVEIRDLLCAVGGKQIPDESAARLSGMTLVCI